MVFDVLFVVALTTSALIAGFYFAFACAVMPALARAGDEVLVDVMRRINVAVLNLWFALAFFGASVATAAALAAALADDRPLPVLAALTTALALSAGAVAVTRVRNVTLNHRLEARATQAGAHAARCEFERAWNRGNVVRLLLAVGAVVALGVAAASGTGA